MERITIDVSRDELNFIREAVEAKINNMKNYFNACEKGPQILKSVTVHAAPEAQWGLKKDGTPRARPGRKSTKVVRKARA